MCSETWKRKWVWAQCLPPKNHFARSISALRSLFVPSSSWEELATGNWRIVAKARPRGAHYTSLGTTTGTLPLVLGTFFIGFVCFSVIESGNFPSSLPPVMVFTVLAPLCEAAWGVNCKGFGYHTLPRFPVVSSSCCCSSRWAEVIALWSFIST